MKHVTTFLTFILLTLFQYISAYLPDKKADLVIFSYNRPLQLYALLESLEMQVTGLGSVSIIYRASDGTYAKAYDELKQRFAYSWYAQGTHPTADFKPLTERAAFSSPHAYIIFAVDDMVIKDTINVTHLIAALEELRAYGFYLRMGTNLTDCYPLKCKQKLPLFDTSAAPILCWRFNQGEFDWAYPHTVDMTLYRKKDIEADIRALNYDTPNMLEGRWASCAKKVMHKTGLCFAQSKVMNVPLNRIQTNWANRHMNYATPQELLEVFNKGLKIDISVMQMCNNTSAHMDCVPVFIGR